jgi:spore coat polysaccharide biosynthesis predicted glycosyltransferase SpsG
MARGAEGCVKRQAGETSVLFRVAAGPRVGYGHLVRALSLAEALGVEPAVSLRGGTPARRAARRLGATLVEGSVPDRVLAACAPGLLVIDDRVAARTAGWRRAARRCGVPIASIHDLGIGLGDADLVIDGSLRHETTPRGRALLGPAHIVLRRGLLRAHRGAGQTARPASVLVALGGGPRVHAAARLARRILERHASVTVGVAGGFGASAPRSAGSRMRLVAPSGFDAALADADVVVTAGGVTLYEACSLGVPSVAVAVAGSQLPTIESVAARGATIDGGVLERGTSSGDARVLRGVDRLLADPSLRRRLGACGRRLVDGRGAERVAAALRRLMAAARGGR